MALDDILLEAEEKMLKTTGVVHHEFSSIRTGKASSALVENIMVEAYGVQMSIKQLAGITTPEPRLLILQAFDPSNVTAIEKAIHESKLGISPLVEGRVIRLPIPELSEERRRELGKLVKKMAEDGRVAIRHVRRDALEAVKKLKKESAISEDEAADAEKETQKLTDQYIAEIDKSLALKEKDIMTV
ncbi:MAG: ribosome recycling factor [Verrucomicrobia bacterium]|nr:ribosome recycling factor [Verrucomicrobiota bacterium]